MGTSDDFSFSPERFSGKVRIFPLPNLVLFPHVVQPLHIFEPRYVEMLEEALADDRLIAMALLAPGWEKDYEGRPPVGAIGCLGHIVTAQSLPSHKYNILLLGLQRVRLLRELPPAKLFREAKVELCQDYYPAATAAARTKLQKELVAAFEEVLTLVVDPKEQFEQILASQESLSILTDILAYRLDLSVELKAKLLAERNVERRARMLLEQLQTVGAAAARVKFPPDFSKN